MKFEIIVLPQAERDLVDTLDYLRAKSLKGALTWLDMWEQTLEWLGEAGDSCGNSPESAHSTRPILQHVFRTRMGNPYRVVYDPR